MGTNPAKKIEENIIALWQQDKVDMWCNNVAGALRRVVAAL
jgi:hypothetical protein